MKLSLLIACFLWAILPLAQAQKQMKMGDKAFKIKDYYTGMKYYEVALKNKEDQKAKPQKQATLYYRYAECCRYAYLFLKSEEYYKKVVEHKEKASLPDVDFWYAYTLKHNGKYALAGEEFKKFLEVNAKESNPRIEKLKPKAEQEIKACDVAQKLVAKPDTLVKLRQLGKNVNTQYSDFAPYEFENELYYSSLRFEREAQGRRSNNEPKEKFLIGKIFTSKDKGTRSATPVSNINIRYESTGNATISPDGKFIVCTRCTEVEDAKMRCQLQLSKRKGKIWQKFVPLPSPINLKEATSTHPHIGFDSVKMKDVLFFVSDRIGGQGELDLWAVEINDLGNLQFGTPENLGTTLNTVDMDATPFFHTQTQTLYFSSKWHEGLGGFDIFKSKRTRDGWTYPSNLGVPFNSAANDLYLWIAPHDTAGYFSSNRTGSQTLTGESCCNDIYALAIPKRVTQDPPLWVETPKKDTPVVIVPVKIDTQIIIAKVDTPRKKEEPIVTKVDEPVVVVNNPVIQKEDKLKEINYLLPLELYFHNDEPDSNTTKTTTKKTYGETFDFYYDLKKTYQDVYSSRFKGAEEQKAARQRMDDFFDNTVSGQYNKLNQCLDGILEALDMGAVLEIQVRGFTSSRASNKYNENLAKRRISSILNYMQVYRNGAMKQFILDKKLILKELPMGELEAKTDGKDELSNLQTIYGLEAAKDRRIELVLAKDVK